jgi:hypothetical protein
LSGIVDEIDENGPGEETSKKPFEGWAYIPAQDEKSLDSEPAVSPLQEDVNTGGGSTSTFTFKNQDDAAMFNDARPPLDVQVEDSLQSDGPSPLDDSRGLTPPEKSTPLSEKRSHGPKSSLSALAKPFEFKPQVSGSFAKSTITPSQKPQGLGASRWAATLSPRDSSADLTASLSSPPADLYHYSKNDSDSAENAEEVVEVLEENTTDDEDPAQQARDDEAPTQVREDSPEVPGLSLRHRDETVPSFEEIDAVMRQFEVNPDLGIERNDTPIQSTPHADARLGAQFRSDAPSPSLSPASIREIRSLKSDVSYPPSFGLGIGVHNLNTGREDVSDWGDDLPAAEEAKLQLRSQFFDGHVNELVGGILEARLGPLERSLQIIQHSLNLMTAGPRPKSDRRSMSTDLKNSDADDEDDYDAFEGFASYREKSPMARRDGRRHDKIRAAVAEALAAYQPAPPPQPSIDANEFNAVLQEMRQLAQQTGSQATQNQLKTIVEDVISQHPRLRGSRVQQDHESAEMKLKPQIDGLETMLKISKEHAAEEARLRRQADVEITELKLRLRIAEEDAAQHRESSEEAQQTLAAFVEEKESYRQLESEIDALSMKNTALETTLQEYRVSSDEWREDIRAEREKNKELKQLLRDLQQQVEDQSHSRQGLRAKVERVQTQMIQAVEDLHAEQADWRQKEHSLQSKLSLLQNELDHERRRREKADQELDALDKEHKANLHVKTVLEQAQAEISRLNELVASVREENRLLDTRASQLDRELVHAVNNKDAELATATVKLQAELESTKTQLDSIRTDSEAQISRLQSRLDHAELDIEDQKAKHDALLSETIETHKEALREAHDRQESVLEDQHQVHEKKLNDLRDRHTRELHNSFDNRTRLEHHLNEKLALSEDKLKHLQTKVEDLEERLAITKSAARAAVEAATAKGVNLPTPASSVVASPPQRAASASMAFAKGSEVPEKISPQALRESIMVLQDQLQNREQKIEQLESELGAMDKEAPTKLKERDTEIGWLRELLGLRVDDLEDIITTVSQPEFDRDAVKDAAIRLRTNLQMEQQLRERAANSFPSMSSLANYAQSPRALPMAAAAAWGNWRRARDTSMGALSDLATTLGSQTPSRSTVGSPASFLSGIMTPPGSQSQKPARSSSGERPPPSMRPLAAAAPIRKSSGSAEARPLRAYNAQPRALSGGNKQPQPSRPRAESPHTPTQPGRPSLDLGADVDDDASLLDAKDAGPSPTQETGPEPAE